MKSTYAVTVADSEPRKKAKTQNNSYIAIQYVYKQNTYASTTHTYIHTTANMIISRRTAVAIVLETIQIANTQYNMKPPLYTTQHDPAAHGTFTPKQIHDLRHHLLRASSRQQE